MLQSVPVLIQSVSSRSSATVARFSRVAVQSGSENFSGARSARVPESKVTASLPVDSADDCAENCVVEASTLASSMREATASFARDVGVASPQTIASILLLPLSGDQPIHHHAGVAVTDAPVVAQRPTLAAEAQPLRQP